MSEPYLVWGWSEFHYTKDQADVIRKLLEMNNGSIANVFCIVKTMWTPDKAEEVVRFIENIKTKPNYPSFEPTTDKLENRPTK